MNAYRSGFSQDIEKFVRYRKASGSWNEYASGQNLKLFDHFCADNYGGDAILTQEMIDRWCLQRVTETSYSCYTRTLVVRGFTDYLRGRGMTGVITPKAPKLEKRNYIPHAFTEEELASFFNACDSIIPYKGRRVSVFRKLQCPVFFRLLYSSGIRTTEARYLKREDVDLVHGVLDIQKSKGYDQHYVALHETMIEPLTGYDAAIDKIQPDRVYFFETMKGDCYGRDWVNDNFKKLWETANGSAKGMIPYDLRHHYAVENIGSWEDDSFTFSEKLHYLSKSMGSPYTQQFKEDAVKYYNEHKNLGIIGCAANLGISKTALGNWIKIYKVNHGEIATRGSGNYSSDQEKEKPRLRKELRDTQDALDILKKAISILGK